MNILFLQAERFLEAMFLLRFKLRKLKRRCRVIQWQYPTFLAFFIIYLCSISNWMLEFTTRNVPLRVVMSTRRFNLCLSECPANTRATCEGCVPCPSEMFRLPGWKECIPWLNCSEIAVQVHLRRRFTHGVTKRVWRAEWNGYDVVLIKCSSRKSKRENCLKGLTNLKLLQGEFATRVIGNCPEKFQVPNAPRVFKL